MGQVLLERLPSGEVCSPRQGEGAAAAELSCLGDLMVSGRGGMSTAMLTKEIEFPVKKEGRSRKREQQSACLGNAEKFLWAVTSGCTER